MNALKRLLAKAKPRSPRLSIIVVIYDMPKQARKTLLSLVPPYQEDVSSEDYEILLLENASSNNLGERAATEIGENIRYFFRKETLPSPVPSARYGVKQARGSHLALMIDGARMASPGLIRTLLDASGIDENAVIAVPGYHLGRVVQQEALQEGYDEAEESRLLESIEWPKDGYRLFDIACFSRSNAAGFFHPNGESNCFCIPRHIWDEVGGFDTAFTETGGGQANPDLYKRVCDLPHVELIATPGQGTFHQFHGGVTTGTPPEEREQHMQNHFAQYRKIRGEPYQSPLRKAILYGNVAPQAMRFMEQSLDVAASLRGEKR